MRIQNWPGLVGSCMIAALIGQSLLAADREGQRPGAVSQADSIDDSDSDEDFSGAGNAAAWVNPYQPVQYDDGSGYGGPGPGFYPPGDGSMGPGMAPSNAWPTTSPFENRIDQTSNVGGLWQNYTDNNYDKKWTFSLDYMYAHGLRPGSQPIGYGPFEKNAIFPGTSAVPSTFGSNLWPTQFTNVFPNLFMNGFRPTLGYDNPDDSGVRLSGFILFENNILFTLPGSRPPDRSPIQALAGIRTNMNGQSVGLFFDKGFSQQYTQQIAGTDLDLYQAPIFSKNGFKLKTLVGAKYLQIHEQFNVEGDASGLNSTISPTTGAITGPFTEIVPPFATTLNSSVISNLVGPTIGLRYDVGGDKFKVWGQSKFGLMADIQRDTVSSTNFAQIIGLNATNSNLSGLPGHPPFSTSAATSNAHVAPLFEQQVNIEFPFFSLVPYVNKLTVFRTANVRIGYNLVFVGEIARPAENINYNYAFPTSNSSRQTFDYSAFNFGVNWQW